MNTVSDFFVYLKEQQVYTVHISTFSTLCVRALDTSTAVASI